MEARVWHRAYDEGVPASIDFEPVTLPGFLRQSAERHGTAPALRFQNRTMSYAELQRDVDRFANALVSLGVKKGSRVAIQLPNLPQTVIAFYAVLSRGAVAVMTNPLYVEREIEHQWNDAECEVAITTDFLFASRVAPIRDRIPVRQYVIAKIPEYLRFPLNFLAPLTLKRADPPLVAHVPEVENVHLFRKLLERHPDDPVAADVTLDDVAALQYTGGTTGVSKGAVLTHGNLTWNTQQIRAWMPELGRGNEVFLAALPFFHVFGLTVTMNLPVAIAAKMVLMPDPREIPKAIEAINKDRVSVFPVVPALVNGINASPLAKKLDVGSLKMCVSGSAPLREDTLRRFEELTGGRILEGFGLTEASPVTHVNPKHGQRKVNHIGLPLPDTDCRIVSMDDPSVEMPAGEEGELAIRGPQVMRGYWNRPEETKDALRDGWLYTGDLAVMDDEGYFRIVGRKKEVIVAGGYNIYPDEIDEVLSSHPSVLECATIGIPDERRGETPKSFVVLRPGATTTREEILSWCRKNLAAYKVPKRLEFRAELPKNSVLKILRRELMEEELRKTERTAKV
jgi:long-chain acyl-CoA synthetase